MVDRLPDESGADEQLADELEKELLDAMRNLRRKNKNIERLLAVFAGLAKEFDNLRLVRIGDRDDFFTDKLDESGLADRVLRPGRVMNSAPYYNAADAYLCMDLHASFGMHPG